MPADAQRRTTAQVPYAPRDACVAPCLTASRIASAVESRFLSTSCSQARTTHQPVSVRFSSTTLSRAMLPAILCRQNSLFVCGWTLCSGHPCQKQPSTNTATCDPGNTRSGRPGRGYRSLYLAPAAHSARLSRSSGPVSRLWIWDIHRRRCAGVMTSELVAIRRGLTRRHLRRGQSSPPVPGRKECPPGKSRTRLGAPSSEGRPCNSGSQARPVGSHPGCGAWSSHHQRRSIAKWNRAHRHVQPQAIQPWRDAVAGQTG